MREEKVDLEEEEEKLGLLETAGPCTPLPQFNLVARHRHRVYGTMLRDTFELDLTHKVSGRAIGVAPRVKLSSSKDGP